MAELATRLEQHTDRRPPTVAIQATTDGSEALFALANPQEDGLGVHLPVEVAML